MEKSKEELWAEILALRTLCGDAYSQIYRLLSPPSPDSQVTNIQCKLYDAVLGKPLTWE